MSDHFPPPVRFIACLSLLLLFAMPQVSHPQSAIGQLETMTGQKIQRYPIKGSMPQSPAGSIGLMLFQSILSEALNAASNSQMTTQQAAQRAELDAWLKAEQQRLNNLVNQQRAKRDVEDKASMEEMAKAMGSGFDTPMPKSDLASALSDPNVVDLRGYPADKPLVVRNLKQNEKPGGTPFFGLGGGSASPMKPEREAQLQAQATKKLQEMSKENRNPKFLDQRLQKLEEELAATLRQAAELRDKFTAGAKEYDLYEKSVDEVWKKALMRGISLLVDLSGKWLQDSFDTLRDDPDKWNRTLQAMDKINKVAMVVHWWEQYAIKSKEVYDYEVEIFTRSKEDLKKDVDFILQNIPADIFGKFKLPYKELKFFVNTSADIGGLFVDLKGLQSATNAYMAKQKLIDIKIKSLVKAINKRREQVAKEMGVSPDSLKKPQEPQELPRIGLGSKVPPLPASLR